MNARATRIATRISHFPAAHLRNRLANINDQADILREFDTDDAKRHIRRLRDERTAIEYLLSIDTDQAAATADAAVIAVTDDALAAFVVSATTRRAVATAVTRAVAAARTAHGDHILALLATAARTAQRGEMVHRLHTDLDKVVFPTIVEIAVKAAAVAFALAEVPAPAASAKAADAAVKTTTSIAALGLTALMSGRYQHTSGTIIERRPRGQIGRNGYAYAGWAVVVDGRETGRWSTLARAAQAIS